MSDRRPEELLRDARAPGEPEAEERAWALVRAAFESRPATPRGPRVPRLAIVLSALAAVLVLALSPAGARVGDLVDEILTVDRDRARPTLSSLPAPGRLLVTSEQGAWVVHEDGSKRLLGDYSQATWSPNGLYVAAVADRQLVAVEPDDGTVRWTVTRPIPVSDPRWSPSGYRVAYRSRRELRVVVGDGTADRLLAGGVAPVAPAWQPVTKGVSPSGAGQHRLAFARRDGRIDLRDADTGERVWRSGPGRSPVELTWSPNGQRLLALDRRGFRLFDRSGRLIEDLSGGQRAQDTAAYRPGSQSFAVAALNETAPGRNRSALGLTRVGVSGEGNVPLLELPGRITDVVWAPDGAWLLAAWEDADQWLFLRLSPGGRERRSVAVEGVSGVFDPGGAGDTFPRVEGWCCP